MLQEGDGVMADRGFLCACSIQLDFVYCTIISMSHQIYCLQLANLPQYLQLYIDFVLGKNF